MTKIILVFLLSILFARSAVAQNGVDCGGYPDVPVNVHALFDAPQYDFSQNLASIQVIASDREHAIPHNELISMGITRYRPALEMHVPMTVVSPPRGQSCVHVQSVDITVGYSDITVFVASEIPRNSCAFTETLGHEEKHVAVNRELLEQFTPLIKERLESYLRLYGVFPVDKAADAEKVLHNRLQDVITEMVQKMDAVNTQRQQEVDSPAEYARLAHVCNGELPLIAGRFRQTHR